MSAPVAPSGECLRGDGRCEDRMVSNFSVVVLAAYLPVLNPAVVCAWPACHSAVPRVSCCILCSVLSSSNKVYEFSLLAAVL